MQPKEYRVIQIGPLYLYPLFNSTYSYRLRRIYTWLGKTDPGPENPHEQDQNMFHKVKFVFNLPSSFHSCGTLQADLTGAHGVFRAVVGGNDKDPGKTMPGDQALVEFDTRAVKIGARLIQ
jgi:hypothetical protein